MQSIQIPGLNKPIDFIPQVPLFRTALLSDPSCQRYGYEYPPLTTLREFTMQHIMNLITEKPSWHTKVFNSEVVKKWENEFLNAIDLDVSAPMMGWCIQELRWKAEIYEKSGLVNVYDGGVVKSDTAVPEELRQALLAAAKRLEDAPDKDKDWHPKTDEKVLDLVHPSLFPLVYGKSRVLLDLLTNLDDCIHRCGEGDLPDGQTDGDFGHYSYEFQWLPCDVDISGDQVQIKSYINNLHPQKHSELYATIEQIIEHTIPLWNNTLSALSSISSQVRRITYEEIKFEGQYDPDQEDTDREENIRYIQPEPGVFDPDDMINVNDVDLRSEYGKTGLQVIIKLANIHLTPEQPEYTGGTWHVEGQMNEHICASAIYYYDIDNITTSSLAFRQQSDECEPMSYPQSYHRWLPEVFGCQQDGSTVQNIGSVNTTQGRLITFPNIFQHQVQPFQLQDPTKPGHRKILAFFLVDPNIRIISTANVPCQRVDWWQELVTEMVPCIGNLPREIQDYIFQFVSEFPMSMDDAKKFRLKLMDERTRLMKDANDVFHDITFNLCEH